MGDPDSKPENISQAKKAHILVVRLSALGDVAILVPVLRVLTATYPELKITVLTRGFFAPIFDDIPNVEIYAADTTGVHSGIPGLYRLAKELRKFNFDAVADLHDVLRSNILNFFFKLDRVPFKQIDKGRAEKKGITAENNKILKPLKTSHQRYADVFADLGFPIDLKDHKFPEKQELSSGVVKLVGKKDTKWLGIAPFAQHKSKVYPIDLMEEVINGLKKNENLQIFLFGGGRSETEKLEALEKKFNNIISLAGKLQFKEELALIPHLDAMLSMDSANAHLAGMLGVPVISLWGVTHPYAGFTAFGQPLKNCMLSDLEKYPKIPTSIYGNKVPAGYEDVMRTIKPEAVIKKVEEALKCR